MTTEVNRFALLSYMYMSVTEILVTSVAKFKQVLGVCLVKRATVMSPRVVWITTPCGFSQFSLPVDGALLLGKDEAVGSAVDEAAGAAADEVVVG